MLWGKRKKGTCYVIATCTKFKTFSHRNSFPRHNYLLTVGSKQQQHYFTAKETPKRWSHCPRVPQLFRGGGGMLYLVCLTPTPDEEPSVAEGPRWERRGCPLGRIKMDEEGPLTSNPPARFVSRVPVSQPKASNPPSDMVPSPKGKLRDASPSENLNVGKPHSEFA